MKTENNIQKTGFGQVKKNTLYGIALLFSTLLISETITASDFKCQTALNSNHCILCLNLTGTTANQTDAAFDFMKYSAQDFVDAEMASEFEYGLNNNAETNHAVLEAELTDQVEVYNANDFSETDLTSETENFMNSNSNVLEVELTDQVEVYNANDFAETDLTSETENFTNSNSNVLEVELTDQVEVYNANDFAEADLTAEIENFMNGNSDAIEAELTLQVEEYNAKNFSNAEIALEIESWMTLENLLKSTDKLSSVTIEKITQK